MKENRALTIHRGKRCGEGTAFGGRKLGGQTEDREIVPVHVSVQPKAAGEPFATVFLDVTDGSLKPRRREIWRPATRLMRSFSKQSPSKLSSAWLIVSMFRLQSQMQPEIHRWDCLRRWALSLFVLFCHGLKSVTFVRECIHRGCHASIVLIRFEGLIEGVACTGQGLADLGHSLA
jgi:hypothetical protein